MFGPHHVTSGLKGKGAGVIGHVYTTSHSQGERHYLPLLLHHVLSATKKSFADLCASPAGELSTTFKATAMEIRSP